MREDEVNVPDAAGPVGLNVIDIDPPSAHGTVMVRESRMRDNGRADMRALSTLASPRGMLSLAVLVLGVLSVRASAQPPAHSVDELLGTWRGTSTCTDKVAAPACHDETVVYEFRRGDKPGHAIVAADKIVDGRRVPMGELDFAWDTAAACWRSDFGSPTVTSRWCFTVDGTTLKGTARLLPGNQIIRRVEVHRM